MGKRTFNEPSLAIRIEHRCGKKANLIPITCRKSIKTRKSNQFITLYFLFESLCCSVVICFLCMKQVHFLGSMKAQRAIRVDARIEKVTTDLQ